MIKAAIIDDELFCVEVIETLLEQNFPNVKVVKAFTNPLEAIEEISMLDLDILFCDIAMPEINGFEVLDILMPFSFKVVFTTAYENHAIKALKYGAIDYLLKPISAEDLKECMLKVFPSVISDRKLRENIIGPKFKKICINNLEGLIFQPIHEILYCESDNSYTTFYISNGKKILASKTMKEYESILVHHGFYRIHNSYLINLEYVEMLGKSDGGYVLIQGEKIPISRTKRDEFLDIIRKQIE
jgi:two-component system, LytTR family, response regulator